MKPLPLLLPFSYIYGAAVALRNLFFEKGIFRSGSVRVPVISVGNITTGGTGKTPIVELVSTMLRDAGRHPAIVSRGYGRTSTGFVLVSDGTTVRARADQSGDEAYQMANKLAGIGVIVDERRARGARRAVERLGCDVVVLDDGFQHRALRRGCDIVLIDAQQDALSMRMLPAGHRREPLSSLGRANAVVITKCSPRADTRALTAGIRRYTDAPVFTSSYDPVSIVDSRSGAAAGLDTVRERSAVVFCGIGQPESFRTSVASLGVSIASFHAYADHHRYTQRDLRDLEGAMKRTGADFFLTTEKDARRLDGAFDPEHPVLFPAMEAAVHDSEKFSALIFSLF